MLRRLLALLMLCQAASVVPAIAEDGDARMSDRAAAMQQPKQLPRRGMQKFEVKDPADFAGGKEEALFSGPQVGEKLPQFTATGVRGEFKDKRFDPVSLAEGGPQVIVFQDESPVGLRGMLAFSRAVAKISERSGTDIHYSAIFLGDDPVKMSELATKVVKHVPEGVQLGVSEGGRDGPGAYGLNRNAAMTVLVAQDGIVTHSFAFTQPMLYPDPHVLGALAAAVNQDRETVQGWLNAEANVGAR